MAILKSFKGWRPPQNIVTGTTSPSSGAFIGLTDGATVTWNYTLGSNAELTIGGNRTLAINNISEGDYGTLVIVQDGTGGWNITLPGTSKVVNGGGGSILLTSNALAEDILSFVYRNSTFYWNVGYNYN